MLNIIASRPHSLDQSKTQLRGKADEVSEDAPDVTSWTIDAMGPLFAHKRTLLPISDLNPKL